MATTDDPGTSIDAGRGDTPLPQLGSRLRRIAFRPDVFAARAGTSLGQLGRQVKQIRARPRLRSRVVIVVTADHGGSGHDHSDSDNRADHTIPLIAWGSTVRAGANLHALAPERKRPRHRRPGYSGRRPIRNGDLTNLALDLLELPDVPGRPIPANEDVRATPSVQPDRGRTD